MALDDGMIEEIEALRASAATMRRARAVRRMRM
jgi:hypothetical protein